MVMPNRYEEPSWWNDLPLRVRSRVAAPDEPVEQQVPPAAPSPSFALIRDLSRLAILFLLVAIANVAVLILALAFVDGPSGLVPLKAR